LNQIKLYLNFIKKNKTKIENCYIINCKKYIENSFFLIKNNIKREIKFVEIYDFKCDNNYVLYDSEM
jgi:hypothetical protein